uniref:Uncharacterized protein n=1 Tax=viral metagenome TaxID=1070528 RepID=A0A6C0IWH5_9ZZZZ
MSITFQEYNWNRVVCIQDPIYPAYLDTESFFKIYGDLLKTFDGSDERAEHARATLGALMSTSFWSSHRSTLELSSSSTMMLVKTSESSPRR